MKTVILDTDIGIDPDDFIALLYGLNSSDITIPLIVTSLDKSGYKKSLVKEILKYKNLENEIKVVKGRDNNGFMDFIYIDNIPQSYDDSYLDSINTVIKNNDEVFYVCLSSLSNFNEYIQKFGNTPKLKLIQMGGNENRCEYNFLQDYDSAINIFNNRNLKKTLITSEITNNENIAITQNSGLYKLINSKKGKEYKLLKENMDTFFSLVNKFYLHDPLTLSWIINPEHFEMRKGVITFIKNNSLYINKYNFNNNGDCNISINTNYKEFLKSLNQKI